MTLDRRDSDIDHSIVRSLNDWFAGSGFRINLAEALAIVPLYVIVGLAVAVWIADWGREPNRRALVLLGLGGAVLALIGNEVLGHFYDRPRPFVAMPNVQLLIAHSKETTFYSDHLAAAGGLSAGIVATGRRRVAVLAVLATIALAIGRVGAGLHYPSDVAAGATAGAVGFLILSPLRKLVSSPVRLVSSLERRLVPRKG